MTSDWSDSRRTSKFFDSQAQTIFQGVPSGTAVLHYSSITEVLVLHNSFCADQPNGWSGRFPDYPARRTHTVVDMVHINNPVRSPRGIVGTMAGPALGLELQ